MFRLEDLEKTGIRCIPYILVFPRGQLKGKGALAFEIAFRRAGKKLHIQGKFSPLYEFPN